MPTARIAAADMADSDVADFLFAAVEASEPTSSASSGTTESRLTP
ncbi:hypothetical protein [Nocardia abscessus]|nr:hypothetical protein [Nocardia abscessus]